MPLSKQRDKERKRLIRLEKLTSSPYQRKAVEPMTLDKALSEGIIKMRGVLADASEQEMDWGPSVDADGNVIPEDV